MSEPEIDLAEVLAWCRRIAAVDSHNRIVPGDVQHRFRLGYSRAWSLLEALEASGDLERVPGPTPAYRPTSGPGNDYSLPLSAKEHGALLRLLDDNLSGTVGYAADDEKTLRQIRARMKRPT